MSSSYLFIQTPPDVTYFLKGWWECFIGSPVDLGAGSILLNGVGLELNHNYKWLTSRVSGSAAVPAACRASTSGQGGG